MKNLRLLILGLLLPFTISPAHARICLLPVPHWCDDKVTVTHQSSGQQPTDPEPGEDGATCNGSGEYPTKEECLAALDASTVPGYSEWTCQLSSAHEGCYVKVELCTDESRENAKQQGYLFSKEEAQNKMANDNSYCISFINESCQLYKCSQADIEFHWVWEEAQRRNIYLDCTSSANAEYCSYGSNSKYSCQAGAEKHCKELGGRLATHQDMEYYMAQANKVWKSWYPHHRALEFNNWALIIGDHAAFQYNQAISQDLREATSSDSVECAKLNDGSNPEGFDYGRPRYYVCIKEVQEKD